MADIKTTGNNIVRVELSEYKEKNYVNIRQWYMDKVTEEYKPTQKGVTLPLEKFFELQEAINELETEVDGILPPEPEEKIEE